MRIGLIRHFPVDMPPPGRWMTSAELEEWQDSYDDAEVKIVPCDPGGTEWPSCISSDSMRAIVTARTVHGGDFHRTALLREPRVAGFGTGNLRLPLWAWRLVLRLAWMTGHRTQRSSRDDFKQRVATVAKQLRDSNVDTLVVSHAGMMIFLGKELRRSGFAGPKMRIPQHALVYVFEDS
jgi:broad specificity phosphatase PhoE